MRTDIFTKNGRSVAMLGGLICLVFAYAPGLSAQSHSIYAPDGLAIDGYDPVAYFTDEAAKQGSPDYSYDWQGATWHFVSEEHRELFVANPERYAPQYGGYCAWAVGRGDIASVDPRQWVVEDGRLFLNFSAWINFRFNLNRSGNIERADENWPEVRRELGSQ